MRRSQNQAAKPGAGAAAARICHPGHGKRRLFAANASAFRSAADTVVAS
jgi:hypothetical protein